MVPSNQNLPVSPEKLELLLTQQTYSLGLSTVFMTRLQRLIDKASIQLRPTSVATAAEQGSDSFAFILRASATEKEMKQ